MREPDDHKESEAGAGRVAGGAPCAGELARELEDLRRRSGELDAFFQLGLEMQCVMDAEGGFVRVNSEWRNVLGYEPSALIGRQFMDFVHPEDVGRTLEARAKLLAKGELVSFDNRYRTSGGDHRWLEWRMRCAGGRCLASARDATLRRQMEDLLRVNEAKFSAAFHTSPEAISITRMHSGEYIEINQAFTRTFGYEAAELRGRTAYDLGVWMREDDRRVLAAELGRGGSVAGREVQFRRRNGEVFPGLLNAAGIDVGGEPALMACISDISAMRQAQLDLRAASERLRLLATAIEQSHDTVVITDAEGTIEYVNPAFEQATGYSRGEALGRNPRILKSGHHEASFYQAMWETLAAGGTWRGRIVNKRKDGSVFHEFASISPVLDEGGATTHYIAVKHDMTGELDKEAQLQQAQKMESIGRLAGGVAHDFNNMLAAIQLNAELAHGLAEADGDLRRMLAEIMDAANRSAGLTRQLLSFARRQDVAPRATDLNAAIRELLKMLRRIIGSRIKLDFRPAGGLWTVFIDSVHIDQILANLVVNARDAIGGSGRITIETSNCRLPLPEVALPEPAAGAWFVCMAVTDSGCGMDSETVRHIFDPFFTTKETGKGTGLGLATVYGIVQQCGGALHVESEPGRGSTFRIFLPRFHGDAQEKLADAVGLPSGAGETILLVEDEASIRRIVASSLERLGYRVLEAGNAAEAGNVIKALEGGIDLLLSDVVMPGIDGPTLAQQLRSVRPGLKCLFMSGHTSGSQGARAAIEELGGRLIAKPFSTDHLAQLISEVLKEGT